MSSGLKTASTARVTCAFCQGRGKDPFGIMSQLSTCCVCWGRGKVLVQTPYVVCAHCRGRGSVKTLTCMVCGGKGVVHQPQGLLRVCPDCGGTGDDKVAPAMACARCRGRGRIAPADRNSATVALDPAVTQDA